MFSNRTLRSRVKLPELLDLVVLERDKVVTISGMQIDPTNSTDITVASKM